MRWDEGDDGADGGDDVDDNPDDARCDDGDDFPLREGIFPAGSACQEGLFFLSRFRHKEAVDKFYEVTF